MTRPTRVFGALRIRHWVHFLVLPFAGLEPSAPHGLGAALRGVGIAFFVLAFGYLLNSVADRAMDGSVAKNPLAVGPAPGAHVYALLLALAAGAVGLSFAAPPVVVVATVVCLASGLLYSAGPRLKGLPVVGTLLNVTNFAPLLWVGVAAHPGPSLPTFTLVFSLLLVQNQLLHEAADREDDARGGVATTVRSFGVPVVSAASAGLGFALALTVASSDGAAGAFWPAMVVFGGLFPWLLARAGATPTAALRVRVAHRFASAAFGALVFVLLRA
ncbi:MAG: UbiA family prenyltransferase [Deltaproteobacteria bacterium]|nr:UbiA family prenyltransferase [Deltaproteobacteria bacterium]